jgi:hypothetical protein
MTRRRESRRRHRAERRERDPAATATMPPPSAAAPKPPRDVSWTGLAGGITGALPLAARSVDILVNGDVSRFWAIPLLVIGLVYAPAIWVSVRPVANRRRVLRNVLVVSLVAMVLGAVFISVQLATLLLIPSSLLAIAAGLLFDRPRQP